MVEPSPRYPVRLTQAQRRIIAEIAPELSNRLKLDESLSGSSRLPWPS